MKDFKEDDLLVELTPEEQEEVKGGLSLVVIKNGIIERPFILGTPNPYPMVLKNIGNINVFKQ